MLSYSRYFLKRNDERQLQFKVTLKYFLKQAPLRQRYGTGHWEPVRGEN